MSDKQSTLKEPVNFSGTGLHTGHKSAMSVKPAPADTGIVFVRTDLPDKPQIPALADYVTDTSRGTTIGRGEAKVSTVEHIVAALWTLGVDNAIIEIDAPETPIMDGSAREYAAAILKAGTEEQAAQRKYYNIAEKVVVDFPEMGSSIVIYPDDRFGVSVQVDYDSKVIGNQYAVFDSDDDFAGEIAPCRTFVFLSELEPLLKANLIKGGDLDNAIVVAEGASKEDMERLSKIFGKRDIEVTGGYINNLTPRFLNEIARHKLLDVLGDMALLGQRIRGKVIATRPGHFVNTETVRALAKSIKREGVRPTLTYNPAQVPVFDINAIKNIIPHRPPFLLVDKIFHIDSDSVAGIKNVTMNEPFFVGHFPEEPVMPGVLVIEAMAQCGGILALHNVEDPENYSTYFLKIDNVRFKQKIVPGDTLQFELRLTEPIRRGIVIMEARAFVGGKLTTEANLTAQVVRNKA